MDYSRLRSNSVSCSLFTFIQILTKLVYAVG